MSYKYDPYTDRFTHVDDEGSTWAIGSFPDSSCTYKLVQQVELTDDAIDRIAEAVAKKIENPCKNCQEYDCSWCCVKKQGER